jgi:hypothetical protein
MDTPARLLAGFFLPASSCRLLLAGFFLPGSA